MDIEAHRDLKLLEEVEKDSRITQRSLATKLGIALGLTNIYLKRLVRKGYIKCVNVQSNRITYLITPRGIAEKARLTYEFMDYSLHLYGEVRQHLRSALAQCAAADKRVAIYGRGEAAELAYLSLPDTLAGERITAKLTTAPGNGAAIGGLKVVTDHGWFAARPSGTENIYKIYAESFTDQSHLDAIVQEAQEIVSDALRSSDSVLQEQEVC